jgi:exodeoxyribonuclease V beta subunit
VTETTVGFAARHDLRPGRVVIEASAGTGKTYTLSGLATRYIAEGEISTSQLLVVTFTRAATDELRARVRDKLNLAASVLAGEYEAPVDDEVILGLCSVDDAERLERLGRLHTALSEFDAATIVTMHGFARQVHRALGMSPVIDPDAELVGDSKALIEEVCTDCFIAEAAARGSTDDLPGLDRLIAVTTEAVRRVDLRLEPNVAGPGVERADLVFLEIAARCRRAVVERRRSTATTGFDDLLVQLRDVLRGPGRDTVIAALRGRYRVALIDEFQDTDNVQWDIFSTLFGAPSSGLTLITVGDPKQAIYRFRGADIHTYLRAVRNSPDTTVETLDRNWRSDGPVLESLATRFRGATFGDDRITFQDVDAAPGRTRRRIAIAGRPDTPVLQVRLTLSDDMERTVKDHQVALMPSALDAVTRDLAGVVRHLLDNASIPQSPDGGDDRPIEPKDIAVLVTRNAHADAVQRTLLDAGIPAVVDADGNVLDSPAAEQVRMLLAALGRPSDPALVRAYALSWFEGREAAWLVESDDQELMALESRLTGWVELLARYPVADVLARIWLDTAVVRRVLGRRDGDRNLTDLDHLAELLHDGAPRGGATVAGLTAILENPAEKPGDTEHPGSVAARRIESELAAVQVMTIHKAKGLEFPIVCLPTLWHVPQDGLVMYAEDDGGGAHDVEQGSEPAKLGAGHWVLDVSDGGPWPDEIEAGRRVQMARAEEIGEQLRLFYVAATRAQHLNVVWWVRTRSSPKSALARFLFGREGGALTPACLRQESIAIPDDDDLLDQLAPLVGASRGTIGVVPVTGPIASPARPAAGQHQTSADGLVIAQPGRLLELDRSVHRWSFSSISQHGSDSAADAHDASGSDRGASDEGASGESGFVPANDPKRNFVPAVPDPYVPGHLTWLPGGTEFGTMVHGVLEQCDFASDELEADLGRAIDRQLSHRTVYLTPRLPDGHEAVSARSLLIDGLSDAVRTPLGPQFDGWPLTGLAAGDRLNEVSFDLRLAGGARRPSLRGIGALTAAHLTADDPMASWAIAVAEGAPTLDLVGYLTGSIDLVARVHTEDGDRYVVADYKTNQLTRRGSVPEASDYGPRSLAAAMVAHDYPLQALLYSVALHRYLRWRLRDYAPERHLGGVTYLFVRGMHGRNLVDPSVAPPGVFAWDVPTGLVHDLSEYLAGRLDVAGPT